MSSRILGSGADRVSMSVIAPTTGLFGGVFTRIAEMDEQEDDGFVVVRVEDITKSKVSGNFASIHDDSINNDHNEQDIDKEDDDSEEEGDGRPEYLREIATYINSLSEKLWPLNKYIHDNPELAFKEYKAHSALTNFMESQPGWQVTRSAYGMETAWVAVFDTGKPGPVVSFNVEMGKSCPFIKYHPNLL